MTISKRTLTTHESDSLGRITVMEYSQVIELVTDSMGSEYERIIESIPNAGVIDPSMGDYDAKVKALGEKLVGSLAAQQEATIRAKDTKIQSERSQKEAKVSECVAHEKRIAELEAEIIELKAGRVE